MCHARRGRSLLFGSNRREDWKPVLNLQTLIYGLVFLLLEPNDDDPLNKVSLCLAPPHTPPPTTTHTHASSRHQPVGHQPVAKSMPRQLDDMSQCYPLRLINGLMSGGAQTQADRLSHRLCSEGGERASPNRIPPDPLHSATLIPSEIFSFPAPASGFRCSPSLSLSPPPPPSLPLSLHAQDAAVIMQTDKPRFERNVKKAMRGEFVEGFQFQRCLVK